MPGGALRLDAFYRYHDATVVYTVATPTGTVRDTREGIVMPDADIVIVGGGAAGLSTAAALKTQGLNAIVLDQAEQIGAPWAQRYERLHLHTVRPFSGLAHYPMPRHYPPYVPKDLVARYLQDYAAHFALDVVTGCHVRAVRREQTAGIRPWAVETAQDVWRCQVVIIATGPYGRPYLPSWPGREAYQGVFLHSSAYRSGSAYRGQRVLVIGAGNSGAEIAADLVEQGASSVTMSVRAAPPIVPRDVLGVPVQVMAMLLTPVPAGVADRLGRFLARITVGDLSAYGLAAPAWLPFTARRVATIDVGFLAHLKRGRITIRPVVARFTPGGVVYADGREDEVAVVIAATGFRSGLEHLLDLPGLLDEGGMPLSPMGQPTAYGGLYFMGYTYSLRGHLFEVNRASRRLARRLATRRELRARDPHRP